MNRTSSEVIFPDTWNFTNVMFKEGDKSNYMPVALLSCIGKLQ